MTQIVGFDTFTDTNWQDLHDHAAEKGGTWRRNGATPSAIFNIHTNKTYCAAISGPGAALYLPVVPFSADYTVSCDYTVKTNVGHVGIAGRMSASAYTYYGLYYDPANVLVLLKYVSGVLTILANSDAGTMSAGGTYELALDMNGTTIRALVDGVEIYSETDSSISAAGYGGVRSASVNTSSTGKHIDNFTITDASTPPTGRRYPVIVGL